jgi:hypothetical protein
MKLKVLSGHTMKRESMQASLCNYDTKVMKEVTWFSGQKYSRS